MIALDPHLAMTTLGQCSAKRGDQKIVPQGIAKTDNIRWSTVFEYRLQSRTDRL